MSDLVDRALRIVFSRQARPHLPQHFAPDLCRKIAARRSRPPAYSTTFRYALLTIYWIGAGALSMGILMQIGGPQIDAVVLWAAVLLLVPVSFAFTARALARASCSAVL